MYDIFKFYVQIFAGFQHGFLMSRFRPWLGLDVVER